MTDRREPRPGPGSERDQGEGERDPRERDPRERDDREPDMSDPEAQRAPGDDSMGDNVPGESPPPMRTRGRRGEAIELDAEGTGCEAIGNDNIREGRVGGVMGAPHAGRGQGQGG